MLSSRRLICRWLLRRSLLRQFGALVYFEVTWETTIVIPATTVATGLTLNDFSAQKTNLIACVYSSNYATSSIEGKVQYLHFPNSFLSSCSY